MTAPDTIEPAYLKPKEAATYSGYSRVTLARWRKKGVGPDYSGEGRNIRYAKVDIDRFMASNNIKHQTA